MGLLVRFLYQNMKGLRALVVLAAIITVLQVSCDIAAAFPLKFIHSKVQNPGNDPACLFPFLNPIESWFDIPQIDPTLQPDPHFAPGFPVAAQCPINFNDSRSFGTASSRKATWSSASPATSPTSRSWSLMAWSICWQGC